MKHLFPNVAAVVLAVAMPAYARTSNTKPAARGALSAAEAKAFVDNAERDLANVSVYANNFTAQDAVMANWTSGSLKGGGDAKGKKR